MAQVALASDFARLHPEVQNSMIDVLELCDERNLACRCEQDGRDFRVVIGRGYSSARYWLSMFAPVPHRG